MELLCVELVMKRKELLGISESSPDLDDKRPESVVIKIHLFVSNKIKILSEIKSKIEDAILSCKIVEVVFKNAIKELKGLIRIFY